MDDSASTEFLKSGAKHFPGASKTQILDLERILADIPADEAGVRITGLSELKSVLSPEGCLGSIAAKTLGPKAKPVRALLFNKTQSANWSLGCCKPEPHPKIDQCHRHQSACYSAVEGAQPD